MAKRIHGIEDEARVKNVSETIVESRRAGEMFFDVLFGAYTPLFVRVTALLLFFIGLLLKNTHLELMGIFIFIIMMPFAIFSKKNQRPLHHIPKHLKGVVKKDPMTKKAPDGEIYIGVQRRTGKQLWLSHNENNMHTAVFGGTGSGKTEFFVSMVWHYLTTGSGAYSIDPKGDVKYPHQIAKMARMLGRDHDLTMVSYVSKRTKADDGYPLPSQTNRLNLINGDWTTEREILVDLMPKAEGNNASFNENAKILIEIHLRAISALANKGALIPSIKQLGIYVNNPCYLFAYLGRGPALKGDKITEETYSSLSKDDNQFKETVKRFIRAVNGDPELTWEENSKNDELRRQSGFVISNTMKVINVFADQFETIFNNPASDVSYIELLKERRVHIELLPSLTKAKETTQLLGKLGTSGMKQALAANIPAQLEGASYEVLNSLPSASRQLYMLGLDEYGAIASESSELIFTQGRSFNVTGIMGTQDKQGGEGATPSEKKVFQQILNNTYLLLGMRVDDPDDTGQFMVKKGHKQYVTTSEGHEIDSNATLGTRRKSTSSYKEVDVVNIRDLAEQTVGEAHVFFGGHTHRIKTPYMDLDLSNNASLNINRLVLFKTPSAPDLETHSKIYRTASNSLNDLVKSKFDERTKLSSDVSKLLDTQQQLQFAMRTVDVVDVLENAFGQFIYICYAGLLSRAQINRDAEKAEITVSNSKIASPYSDDNNNEYIDADNLEDQGEYEFEEDEGPTEFIANNTMLECKTHHEKSRQEYIDKCHEKGVKPGEYTLESTNFTTIITDPKNEHYLTNPSGYAVLTACTLGGEPAQDLVENKKIFKYEKYKKHDPDAPFLDLLTRQYYEYQLDIINAKCDDDINHIEAAAAVSPTHTEEYKSSFGLPRAPKAVPEAIAKAQANRKKAKLHQNANNQEEVTVENNDTVNPAIQSIKESKTVAEVSTGPTPEIVVDEDDEDL